MTKVFGELCTRICCRATLVATLALLFLHCAARADVVTDWNKNAEKAILGSSLAGNSVRASRVYVLMHAAIFDAVNGIKPHYTPYHVDLDGPQGASTRAAAIQAAYVVLVSLFPSQKSTFDAERAASLASLADDADDDSGDEMNITRGLDWGELVANDILIWRSTDGFSRVLPPVTGGLGPGHWRPTPPQFLPMANLQVATMTPYVMDSPSQFRPAGPPALTSERYTDAFNEVKALGRATGSSRTDEQTLIAQYWAGNTSVSWNRVCNALVLERELPLNVTARLYAVMNLALADSTIAGWDSKLFFIDRNWRPITAIVLADTDGNPNTTADPAWTPLLTTPAHPEYVSAHAIFSAGASGVLADFFGDSTSFSLESVSLPGTVRTYTSFSSALAEAKLSRIYGGIHFRFSVDDGAATGAKVAEFVLDHVALPLHGRKTGQTQHDHPRGEDLSVEGMETED
jgi:PAP2 superfamily